jgi:hypothetical protein
MRQHKGVLCLVFFTLLLSTSCRKDIPKGQLIQADGFVIDSVINKKLSNVTVYLYGAHATFYGVFYGGDPLDSAISDSNGNFSIKYSAEGHSVDYSLAVGNVIYGGYSGQNNCVIDASHPSSPFNYSHHISNLAVCARKLNYARVNLKVISNPYDTLYLDVSTTYGELFIRNQIVGKSIDTSFLTRYLPNRTNTLEYKIISYRLLDSGWFLRRMPDTLAPELDDTVVVTKVLNSTYEIPLKPY